MTDQAWVAGMARLKACTLDRTTDEAVQWVRWQEYRNQLDHLSDEQWQYALDQGVREEFMPSIGALARWGAEMPYRRGSPGALQIEDGQEGNYRSEEEMRINREGLRQCMEELAKHGIYVGDCAKRMPSAKA